MVVWRIRLVAKIDAFQASEMGSKPICATLESSTARAVSGLENRDGHRKVRGSIPLLSATYGWLAEW